MTKCHVYTIDVFSNAKLSSFICKIIMIMYRVVSLDKKRQKYREIVSFVYNFMALFKLGKIRTVILHEYFFGSFFITKAIIHGI